ncbi:MAG: VWA-like domain-containing protein [Gammaproteobacteria bacterium]|nr:VWA-like domain-containing protein [Gammaproteobacteria bacterium]
MDKVERKLIAARTRLVLDKPFLGALVLRLPIKAADSSWCETTATDARAFYFNHDYIGNLSLSQTQFVLAHEALHCALSHFARRQHRNKRRWDVACDLAVNPLLVSDGLVPPPNALYLEEYAGMTAEEIYPLVDDDNDQRSQDDHVYDNESPKSESGYGSEPTDESSDSGAARPPPLGADERANLQVRWQQRMAGASQQAMRAGKLAGLMARMVEHLLQPQIPWRSLLARYLTMCGREEFNYTRPSRRQGEAIFPSLRNARLDVVVAVDTSGSVSKDEMDQFFSEVEAIKAGMQCRIILVACDTELAPGSPWIYEPWEAVMPPMEVKGGGGTSFRPVFEWVEQDQRNPDLLIYFTDAEGEFPAFEPEYPVLWLVKGKAKVPWGQRIQLN